MPTSRFGRALRRRYPAIAGVLLFTAGLVAFMGIVTAEALYPGGYSTSLNKISDLAATQPPDSVISQPSATIFNVTMIVCGVLALAGAHCLQRGTRRWAAPILIALFGLGALGVGLFPGNTDEVHEVFALLTFIAGGTAAVLSWTVTEGAFRYFSALLGLVSLATLFIYWIMGDSAPFAGLGIGGVERWVVYPLLLWATGLGGHLMGRSTQS